MISSSMLFEVTSFAGCACLCDLFGLHLRSGEKLCGTVGTRENPVKSCLGYIIYQNMQSH